MRTETLTHEDDGTMIQILPLVREGATDDARKQILEVQLKMATSSINHEYARAEYDRARDYEHREELLQYMHDCRCQYFEARSELSTYDPYALMDFEADLIRQKLMTMTEYNA